MSTLSLLARGSLAALVLGAAVGATAQSQTPSGAAGGTAANAAATVDAAFKRADTNGDSKLSPDELKQIPQLASRFGDLDTDKDGAISNTEFSAGVTVKAN
jgi:hypothetical protein